MAKVQMGGGLGNLVINSIGGDLATFNIRGRQAVDNTTNYNSGAASNHHGSGVTEVSLDFSGFCVTGTAGNALGLTTLYATASNFTATLQTGSGSGSGYIGAVVIESLEVRQAKTAGSVPFSGNGWADGPVAEFWVVS